MNQGYDSDIEDSFGEYQRSIRGRAKVTLDELQGSLRDDPVVHPSDRHHNRSAGGRQSGFRERSGSWSGGQGITEHADYVYGAAADKLQSMLHRYDTHQQTKNVQFRSPSKYSLRTTGTRTFYKTTEDVYGSSPPPPRGYVPSSEEALPLLQNQSVLLQQLETENKFIKEELSVLKQRQRELVEENRLLHEELKKSVVQEILQGAGHHQTVTDDLLSEINRTDINVNVNQSNLTKWKYELERLNALHAAKTKHLEGQLRSAKSEVESQEKEIMELRTKLRLSESGAKEMEGVKGLCVRCGQSEAVLPATYANQTQAIDRLAKERDDLVSEMMRLRGQIQELRGKEEDAYQHVKKSVEMVEQAQLEQTQAMIQSQQLKEELMNLRNRMQEYTEEMSQKMSQERASARNETSKERQDLNNKIEELTTKLTQTQLQLDKVSRDKVSLITELDSMKQDVSCVDSRFYQATDGMRVTVTTANVEREAAMRELKKAKQENDRLETNFEADKQRLKTELQDLRRRLDKAETDLVAAKEDCIHLHTTNQSLEREIHLAKLAKDAIERTRSDDISAMTKRAQQREDELNVLLETLQSKHAKTTGELEDITKNQRNLIQKLREECRNVTEKLESVTKKYKEDNKNLKTQVDQFKIQASKHKRKIGDLEQTNEQHSLLQNKMRERLKEMDSKAQRSGQQILDLLAKEGTLMKDRHLLAGEVKFLREQLECYNHHQRKRYSYEHHQVDDILNNVKVDYDSKNRKYEDPTFTIPPTLDEEQQRPPSPLEDIAHSDNG